MNKNISTLSILIKGSQKLSISLPRATDLFEVQSSHNKQCRKKHPTSFHTPLESNYFLADRPAQNYKYYASPQNRLKSLPRALKSIKLGRRKSIKCNCPNSMHDIDLASGHLCNFQRSTRRQRAPVFSEFPRREPRKSRINLQPIALKKQVANQITSYRKTIKNLNRTFMSATPSQSIPLHKLSPRSNN